MISSLFWQAWEHIDFHGFGIIGKRCDFHGLTWENVVRKNVDERARRKAKECELQGETVTHVMHKVVFAWDLCD